MLIKIDTDKLQTVVNNLNDRAEDINSARRSIHDSSYLNHDPVPEVSEATELSSYATTSYSPSSITNLHTCAQTISNLAAELAARRQEAININSSGITFNGAIGYYLPDPPEDTLDTNLYWQTMETPANIKAYNSDAITQARTDAQAAQETYGQELLDLAGGSIYQNRDNPVYATIFADTLGAQGMAEYAYNLEQAWETWKSPSTQLGIEPCDREEMWEQQERLYTRAQSAASVLLGTATTSTIWSKQHRRQYAEALAALATDEKAPSYGSYALNLLLSGVDHSATNSAKMGGTYIRSGGVFDEEFLNIIESSIWLDEQQGYPQWQEQAKAGLSSHHETSYGDYDPYTGILTAMGRNPQAALNYLAPLTDYRATGPTAQIDDSRYKWLASRDWDQVSLEGLTAAVAGVSGFRTPTSSTLDERAAQLTELATVSLAGSGEHGIKDPQWDGISRRNLSAILSNSIAEVDNSARDDRTGTSNAFDISRSAPWKETHEPEVRKLLQEAGKDDSALATLGAAAGEFSRQRAETKAAETGSIDDVTTAVKENNTLAGYILGAAQKGRNIEDTKHDASVGLFFNALSEGLSFIPSPQSKVAAKAISLGTQHALKVGQEALTHNSPETNIQGMGEALKIQNKITAFNALSQQDGALPDAAFQDAHEHPYHYPWLQGRTIDPSYFKLSTDDTPGQQFYNKKTELNDYFGDTDMPQWAANEIDFGNAFKAGREKGSE